METARQLGQSVPKDVRETPPVAGATGTVATEPEFLYRTGHDEQLPILLLDARTREDQSGSPVILFRYSGEVIATDEHIVKVAAGTQSKLLGV